MKQFLLKLRLLLHLEGSEHPEEETIDETLQMTFARVRETDPRTGDQWRSLRKAVSQANPATARTSRPIPRFAYALAAVALVAVGGYFFFTSPGSSPETFMTRRAEQKELVLGDGSRVTLNYASELTVLAMKQGEPRRVSLAGEAYFRVRHNETPFVISTQHASVAVVGTEFNLLAREETIAVAVLDGSVNFNVVKEGRDSTLQLSRNQRAVCAQDGFPERIGDVPSVEYPGWLHGKLFLDKTTFPSACREIEMRFDITIRISDPRLRSEIITGILDARNAGSAVAALCELTGKKFDHDGQDYTIY